ncbi:translation initiation factor IF-2 [Streptomyces xanthochromogenes]|nr:translation initiation factor IF-2 [Streptomyces xanthochromogenes]
MSHEAMLAWLDQANSGTVQGAADRLAAAAKEIRKIADDLKVRPQWVDWKGAGADAFRTWSADLANATLRLGDFSEGSSTWLGHASDAIASAQAAIPRDKPGAEGNLAAAQKAHNDPDAAAISRKSTAELAALEADKEKVRQEAVAQMRKLGQAYQQSATQMNGLERPKFPPPPQSIAPDSQIRDEQGQHVERPGGAGQSAPSPGHNAPTGSVDVGTSASVASGQSHQPGFASHERPELGDAPQPSRMDVDSVASLPPAVHTPAATGGVPGPTGGGDPSLGRMPSLVFGEGLSVPSSSPAPGRSVAGGRSLVEPGRNPSGRNAVRTPEGGSGITGGRSVPAPPGRPSSGVPRGTVVGAGETEGRGAARPVPGAGPAGQTVGRPGAMPGGNSMAPRSGVSGGNAQQAGRAAGTRSVSSGGAAERGGISGGRPVVGNAGGGAHGGRPPSESRKGRSRREASGRGPGYLVEDDETWVRDDPRVVPPVID